MANAEDRSSREIEFQNSVLELLQEHLEELKQTGFLERLSMDKYAFSNNLTWEVIYKTLMFAERRRLHELVGRYFEESGSLRAEDTADLLLFHFEAAKNHPKAAYYGLLAGDKAANIYANRDALKSYGRAVDSLLEMGEPLHADLSLAYERIADVHQVAGEHEAALENYTKAYSHWQEATEGEMPRHLPADYDAAARSVELCRKTSVTHEYASNFDEAHEWIEKAIGLISGCPDQFASRVYTAKSVIHFRKGEYKDAIASGEQALALAKTSGVPAAVAYSHTIVANSLLHVGKVHDAVNNYRKGVALYRDLQDYVGIASSNSNLASCLTALGQLDKAIEYYNVALEAEKKIQSKARIAIDYNNLGEVFLQKGELERSVEYFDRVVQAYRRGETHIGLAGYAKMNLSRCYRHLGELEKAEEMISRSLEMIREAGVHGIYVEAELHQGELFFTQGRIEEAEIICNEVIAQIKEQGANLLLARGKRLLAKIACSVGNLDGAVSLIGESIRIARKHGSKYEEGLSTKEYAMLLTKKGAEKAQIERKLVRALELFEKIGATGEYNLTLALRRN